MKIYFIHATSYPNYKQDLYQNIRQSDLNDMHEFHLPHEKNDIVINSKNLIASCDLIIAEVSYPSIGLGIELGWAESKNKNVLFVHKTDAKPSTSLSQVSNEFLAYTTPTEMMSKISSWIDSYVKKSIHQPQPETLKN